MNEFADKKWGENLLFEIPFLNSLPPQSHGGF